MTRRPMSHLVKLTSPLAAGGHVLVVPLGATEQHGPHLPLTTDTTIAAHLAAELAERRPDVVVAPALPFGSSGEHQDFPGTLSIGAQATEELLVELCRSATCTWPRILLLCTHGGNAAPLRSAVQRLRTEGRDVRAWGPTWPGDAHAGHVETSVMLHLDPEVVASDQLVRGASAPIQDLMPALVASGVSAVSPNGVLGDATEASASEGRALLEQAADDLERFVARWSA